MDWNRLSDEKAAAVSGLYLGAPLAAAGSFSQLPLASTSGVVAAAANAVNPKDKKQGDTRIVSSATANNADKGKRGTMAAAAPASI